MLISKQLIAKFLPKIYDIDDQQFTEACNCLGIEVERVIKHPILNNLVIGEIIKIENHPNADKLHFVQVRIGNGDQINNIVCGAGNLEVNRKVIVALNGAKLHDGRVIEYKEIRGILSQGMICAYGELTPHSQYVDDEDAKGIILLDNAIIGDNAVEKYVGLDDVMYELSLPSNRNDLNGALSLCQELSGYFKWDFHWINTTDFKGMFKEEIKLNYQPDICSGLCAIKIKDINRNKSNWLLKSLLMNNGVKPLNNTLDRLAYVTLLTNVPTAVYDANKISNELNVKFASPRQEFIGFGQKKYMLDSKDIIVESNNLTIGLAGVLGSEQCGVSNQTKDIIIEVANFNYVSIRETAIRLDIKTDAARRFSKEISNYLLMVTLSYIFEQFNNLQISYPVIKVNPSASIKIDVNLQECVELIGISLNKEVIQKSLTYLGFGWDGDKIEVPPHRLDIKINQDIAEEITKIVNINELTPLPITAGMDKLEQNEEYELLLKLKQMLISNYYNEVKTYNLTSDKKLTEFNVFKYSQFIKIENAHNSARAFLRSNLVDGLLSTLTFNNSYKTQLLPIFEIQNIYTQGATNLNLTVLNEKTICLDHISHSNIIMNLAGLKSLANTIASIFNTRFDYFITKDNGFFYTNEVLAIHCNGKLIGYVGNIKASKLKEFDLQTRNIYCLTINLNILFDLYHPNAYRFHSVSNLMPIFKDISFFIRESNNITNMLDGLNTLSFISHYEFIDRYVDEAGRTSYTMKFRFDNASGLDSKAIEGYIRGIEKVLIESNCEIRNKV